MKAAFRVTINSVLHTMEEGGVSPQQVGRPDDGQVLAVHVGDVAERCQAGKVPHEELQGPTNQIFIYSDLIASQLNGHDRATFFSASIFHYALKSRRSDT